MKMAVVWEFAWWLPLASRWKWEPNIHHLALCSVVINVLWKFCQEVEVGHGHAAFILSIFLQTYKLTFRVYPFKTLKYTTLLFLQWFCMYRIQVCLCAPTWNSTFRLKLFSNLKLLGVIFQLTKVNIFSILVHAYRYLQL